MKALKNRKTERSYTDTLISIQHLSTVLWAAYGINRQDGKRTVPTAYGKDYMKIFVIYNDRAYKFIPEKIYYNLYRIMLLPVWLQLKDGLAKANVLL